MSSPASNAPRAVFFDFDGVLADTENIHVAAWQRTLAGMGWALSEEIAIRSVEIDDRQFLKEVFEKRGIVDGDVEGWIQRKQELTIALLGDSPRLYPGVKSLVQKLVGRVELAVVSTTWRENIIAVLKASELLEAFPIIVGKEDVEAVKPDPEAYRQALRKAGVEPFEAVAIEDSLTGLTAARRASIPTLAVGHRQKQGEWSGDSPYLDNLLKPDEVLGKLGLNQGD